MKFGIACIFCILGLVGNLDVYLRVYCDAVLNVQDEDLMIFDMLFSVLCCDKRLNFNGIQIVLQSFNFCLEGELVREN